MHSSSPGYLLGGTQLSPQYFSIEEISIGQYLSTERGKAVPVPGSYGFKDDYGQRIFQLLSSPLPDMMRYGNAVPVLPVLRDKPILTEKSSSPPISSAPSLYDKLIASHPNQPALYQ